MRYLLALLMTLTLQASDPWTTRDTWVEVICVTSLIVDWGQTLNITSDKAYYETNPVLGPRPSRSAVNRYFATAILTHVALAYVLPKKLRVGYQLLTIGLQFSMIHNNSSLGVKFTF